MNKEEAGIANTAQTLLLWKDIRVGRKSFDRIATTVKNICNVKKKRDNYWKALTRAS